MQRELRDKWIAALRSGTYTQTFDDTYHDGTRFCAIGVLFDVTELGTWQYNPSLCFFDYIVTSGTLSEMDVDVNAPWEEIITMNDEDRKSFAEIADWIEANVPVDEAE